MAETNNTYTDIKSILKQFELQIVQAKHYTKDQTYTKAQVTTAINNAIAGVNHFSVVKSTGASNTPQGVQVPTMGAGTDSETPGWIGTLAASSANAHTIYFVPSVNGLDDQYDEYMAINGAWEKIGNTDVNLSGYVPTSRTVNGHALSSNVTVTKSDVNLGNVTNVATESTITQDSAKNITSGAVYSALNASITESSDNGVTIGGKVNAPTITVTPGSIVAGNTSVITGGTIYEYAQPKNADLTAITNLTGTSGVLTKTAENTWELSSNYATKTYIDNKDYISSSHLEKLDILLAGNGTGILKRTNATAVGEAYDWDTTTYVPAGTSYSSSDNGVALGGTAASPTITVTEGSVASGNTNVVTGGAVYTYAQPKNTSLTNIAALSGTSGVLTKTGTNTWALNTTDYATKTWVENQEYISSLQLSALDSFLAASTTTGILRRTNGAPANQQFAWDTVSDSDFEAMLSEV